MKDFNAKDYETKMMKGVFREVYPLIARQIIERTGMTKGKCVDLGGGPGMLGICIAEISDLDVTICDQSAECVELALANIAERHLSSRMTACRGEAEQLPFEDNSVDLVISRGSIYFWKDQALGLREIHRVLKPHGWAYVGGGFGSARLAEEAMAEFAKDEEPHDPPCRKFPPKFFRQLLDDTHIDGVVDTGESGKWIIWRK